MAWAVLVCAVGCGAALGLLTALHGWLGALGGFDQGVQEWVHGWASPGVGAGMRALTELGRVETFLPAAVFVGVGMVVEGRRRGAGALGLAMVGALALNEGLKLHFARARPGVSWALGDERTYSFPSGHALFAVTLYGTLTWLAWRGATAGRRVGLAAVAGGLTVGIGVSRVYLGMHWPTDVLAGYAVGVVWVGTVMTVERVWERYSSG